MTQGAPPPPPGQRMLQLDGTPVFVSPAEAAEGYRSGSLAFDPSDTVPIQTANGIQTVSGDQAANLLDKDNFTRLGSYTDYARQQDEQIYGGIGNAAAAAGVGVGNALTVGAGRGMAVDFAGSLFGADAQQRTREYLRGLEEHQQAASLVGEGAGLIAPMLLSGGTAALARGGAEAAPSLLGRASSVLTAPTRAVAAIGEGASGAVRGGAKALGFAGDGLAARALSASAQGAAEMSLYSAGDAYSRSRLEDRELTGEQLLAAAGHGALTGAMFGGGLVVGGAALGATMRGVGKVAEKGAEKVAELTERMGGQAFAPSTILREQALKATGANLGQIEKLVGTATKSGRGEEVVNRAVQMITEDIPKVLKRESLQTVSHAEMYKAAKTLKETANAEQQAILREADAAVVKHGTGGVDLEAIANKARAEILTPAMEGAMLTSEKQGLREVDQLIKDISDVARDGKSSISDAWQLRRRIDGTLSKEPGRLNAGERAIDDAKMELRWLVENALGDAGQRALEKEGSEMAVKWALAKKDVQAAHWIEEATGKGANAELRNNSGSLRGAIMGGGLSSAGATVGTAALGPVGGIVGGLAGAALGHVTGNLVKNYGNQIAATLAKRVVETDILRAVGTTVNETLGANVSSLVRGVRAKAPTATATLASASRVESEQKANKQADFERRRKALIEFAAAPGPTLQRTMPNAPQEIRADVAKTAMRGAEYLQSIAPKQVGAENPLQPKTDMGRVDPAERDRWLRAARAVDDPTSIVADARKGALTAEAVRAVAAVYPRIYGQIQGQVMAEIAERKTPLGYRQAQQISILLGQPATASLTPEYLAAVQSLPVQSKPLEAGKIQVKQEPDRLGSEKMGEAT